MDIEVKAPDGKVLLVRVPSNADPAKSAMAALNDYKNSAAIKKTATFLTTPFRGYRGAAVGLENLVAHPTQPSQALSRAAEAVQTGFRPSGIPETAASMLGESVPLMPLGGVLSEGSDLAKLIKLATTGAGTSALFQTSEEGKPTVGQTALAGAFSAVPDLSMMGVKKIFPPLAAKFTKTVPEAYRGITTAFKQKFPGTSEAIASASSKVVPALEGLYKEIGDRLRGRKTFMGMNMTTKEALEESIATGGEPRNISRIGREFKGIQKRSAPIIEKTSESKLINPKTNKPFMKVEYERGIPKGEKLRRLDDMAQDINKITDGSYSTDVYQTKKAIENAAIKTGQTSYKIYQKFKQQWGKVKEIESNLGSKLTDTISSGKEIENVVRSWVEKGDRISSSVEQKLNAVRQLENMTHRDIINPLKNQILSSYTNEPLSPFVPKGMLGKILLMKYFPEGLASYFLGSPKIMGKIGQSIFNPPTVATKLMRSTVPSAVDILTKRREEQ